MPVNVGFGIPYVLPLITELLISGEEHLLLIENPESHLHPKGQTMIARLISLAAENGCQIICESHSDHVINGVRVAVKQQLIDNKRTGISFLTKNDNQETKITNIFVDHNGNLSDYPSGLLDEWPYNPYERKFIKKIRENGLIEIVLPWTDKGYGIVVKTTGRSLRETERIAELIEEDFGYI